MHNSSLKRLFPAELRTEEFEGYINELLSKLIACDLVVCVREIRMRGIAPDFPRRFLSSRMCSGAWPRSPS